MESRDVTLLTTLDALLQEANVTLAAKRLGLSTSAASHALARVRLDDPILVRAGRKMVLTPRAEERRPREWETFQAIEARFAGGGPRARRIGIVVLARTLWIAPWRYVTQGAIPDGAVVKAAASRRGAGSTVRGRARARSGSSAAAARLQMEPFRGCHARERRRSRWPAPRRRHG